MDRAAFLLTALFALAPGAGACVAESGPGTAALVELYTSEGCSSCPPAERWLAGLTRRYPEGSVVPLAVYVDYWDYIGSKNSLRQRKLSPLQRLALAHTPQVLLQGAHLPGWDTKALDDALARINGQPAKARLRLEVLKVDAKGLEVEARAELAEPMADDAVLYLAAYRSGLESRARAGEHRGRILAHDRLVLEWLGPFGFQKEIRLSRRLELLPGAAAENSGAAAFVQNRRTGEVLQALLRSAC